MQLEIQNLEDLRAHVDKLRKRTRGKSGGVAKLGIGQPNSVDQIGQ